MDLLCNMYNKNEVTNLQAHVLIDEIDWQTILFALNEIIDQFVHPQELGIKSKSKKPNSPFAEFIHGVE